jgi:putative DNA primase/helicase
MAPIPERPSRDQAEQALALLNGLLDEVAFVGEHDRSVALSGLITPVARGGLPTVPLHVFRSSTAGSGKTYMQDLASFIATGQHCHVFAAGKDDEEMEKRLVAVVLAGRPIFGIDNVNREIGSDFLCQLLTSTIVCPRPLGKSESPRIHNHFTGFANGNGILVRGDLTRRTILCTIDPRMERPEDRVFKRDPIQEVKKDRGRYVAAALTVVRAYIVAGRPDKPRALAGFVEWSDTVRGALMWLGQKDPLATMETVRAEDPKRRAHAAMLHAWLEVIGEGPANAKTAAQVLSLSDANGPDAASIREAIADLGVIGRDPKGWSRRLGSWLAGAKTRIIDGLYFTEVDQGRSKKSARYYVEGVINPLAAEGGGTGGLGGYFNPPLRERENEMTG